MNLFRLTCVQKFTCRRLQLNATSKKKFTPQYKWDRVPQGASVIFESNVKDSLGLFKFSSGLGVLGAVGYMTYSQIYPDENKIPHQDLMIGGFIAMTSALCIFVHVYGRKFFKRIYYDFNARQFIAVRRTWTGRLDQIKFSPKDVVIRKKGVDIHDGCVVKINGRLVYLGAHDFLLPRWYNAVLGFSHEAPEDIGISRGHHHHQHGPYF